MPRHPVLVLQHSHAEFLAQWEVPFETLGIGFDYCRPYVGDAVPLLPQGHRLVISLGGPMGPRHRDEVAHLKGEERFLRIALREGVTVVGIELGGQLLATGHGGRVEPCDPFCTLTKAHPTEAGLVDPLLAGLSEPFPVLRWQTDRVTLPADAVVLAVDPQGEPLIARIGAKGYALWFHPQVKSALLEDMVMEYGDFVPTDPLVCIEAARGHAQALGAAGQRLAINVLRLSGLLDV
ncbi:MAG: hypothetical protein COX57_11290 [Alphaproteobacteria bacterium CG_4_10_14_0_2_um_filter_63_37]|nr:MAG: hypothetical protein AUJ55_08735 [Proteobacteria bacterium CG1_02_64_396]PJA23882.1 MAG: hypothetical protein COX57_11290 [Alphaproteobacteria bacterium CG_4_10_14_0_2_um_filter_63_37]